MIEIDVLRNLQHPNITKFFKFFEENNELIIIMEYCEKEDLKKLINRQASSKDYFQEDQIMEIFVQVCQALEYVHSNKIIHRDLKPENILISGELYKIGDFGISAMGKKDDELG
jgi:serine/threonine protein kinase